MVKILDTSVKKIIAIIFISACSTLHSCWTIITDPVVNKPLEPSLLQAPGATMRDEPVVRKETK